MSVASRARQQARLARHAQPVGEQTLEQAQAGAIALHKTLLGSRARDILAAARGYFCGDDTKKASDVKLKFQRGRWFLVVRDASTNRWNTIGSGPTQREAFVLAVQRAEGNARQRAAENRPQESLSPAQVSQIERELGEQATCECGKVFPAIDAKSDWEGAVVLCSDCYAGLIREGIMP